MKKFLFLHLVFAICSSWLQADQKIVVKNFSIFDISRCGEGFEKIAAHTFDAGEGSVLDLHDGVTLTDPVRMERALTEAKVPKETISLLLQLMKILKSEPETKSVLGRTMNFTQGDGRNPTLLCILTKNCDFAEGRKVRAGAGYYASRASTPYEIAGSGETVSQAKERRDKHFGGEESGPKEDLTDQEDRELPSIIFVPVDSLRAEVPEGANEAALPLVKKFMELNIHEKTHEVTDKTILQWVRANEWRIQNGRNADPLFERYTRIEEGRRVLDEGMIYVVSESVSFRGQAEADFYTSSYLPMMAKLPANPANRKKAIELELNKAVAKDAKAVLGRFLDGTYGEPARATAETGIVLGEKTIAIGEANVMSIGQLVLDYMAPTIDEYEKATKPRPK